MDKIRTSIISSRLADEHYNNIVAQHADLISRIKTQEMKVEAFNQQKMQEKVQKQQLDTQNNMAKEKMMGDLSNQQMKMENDRMSMEQKNKELELKRIALTSQT